MGSAEMTAQWLGTLTALSEDLGSIPRTHTAVKEFAQLVVRLVVGSPSCKDPNALFWPL